MGAGKSAVISPVLALKLTRGLSIDEQIARAPSPLADDIAKEKAKTRLCIVIVPESLLASTLTVMRTSFSGLVQKPVLHFQFDRSSCNLKVSLGMSFVISPLRSDTLSNADNNIFLATFARRSTQRP